MHAANDILARDAVGHGASSNATAHNTSAYRLLAPGAARLFEAIRDVPGAYRVYCTYQCNEAANCRTSTLPQPVTISPKGVNPVEAYMVKQHREGTGTSIAATKEAVRCADLMMLPIEE